MSNGLSIGIGLLMLPFCILCPSTSFALPLGSRIAVRILLVLALRECAGRRRGLGAVFSFNDRLIVRVCPPFVESEALGKDCESWAWFGDTMADGEDAIVPPTPVLDVVGADIIGVRL